MMFHQSRNDSMYAFVIFIAGLALGASLMPKFKRKMWNKRHNWDWDEMKDDWSEKYEKGKDSAQAIYEEVVDEATDKYAKAKGIAQNELVDLVDDLKTHWKKIKHAWSEE
jgi:hypothetical protein